MKFFYTLLLTVFAAVILHGTEISADASFILLDDVETVTVNHDGSSETSDRCIYKIANYDGLVSMRSLHLPFNSDYSTLSVTHLAIVKPDGRKILLDPAENSSIAVDTSQMDSAIFDPASKLLNVRVPGLEIGDILEITTFEKEFKSRMTGQWCDIAVLQGDFPIVRYEYIVDLPSDKPILSMCVKDEVKGTLTYEKTERNGRTIYKWTAVNVPQVTPENHMPPMYMNIQRVLLSTVADWKDVSRWYAELCAGHLAAVNDDIREKTAELIADKQSDMEKIRAVFQFVSQHIRYTGITDEDTAPGYEPHDVSQTFDRRHGVCRDKAALLTAMLKLAGFNACPVLFMAGSPKDPEVPNIYFNHAVTAVENSDGSYILMDPTVETTTELFPSYLAGDPFLPAKDTGASLQKAPAARAEDNIMQISTSAELDGNVLHVESKITFTGIYDQMYRDAFSLWTEKNIENFFSAQVRKIAAGAILDSVEITPENIRDMSVPLALTLRYDVQEFLKKTFSDQLMPVPRSSMILGMLDSLYSGTFLQERRFPLKTMPRTVKEDIRIDMSDADVTFSMPEKTEIAHEGILRVSGNSAVQDNIITENFFFAVDTMLVMPQDYPDFRDAAAKAEEMWQTLPIVRLKEKNSGSGENFEILKHSQHIFINDSGSWQTDIHIVKKINNYAGVKNVSNMSIPYVEGMETVDIQASVTTADGKVLTLSPKEINRMDDELSAAAPRYFKRKIAVISFPGAAPDAVIDCRISVKTSDRPFFYTELITADDVPVLEKEVIIDSPSEMDLSISELPADMDFTESADNGRTVRRFSVKNCSVVPPEPARIELSRFVPVLRVSAGDNASLYRMITDAANRQVDAAEITIPEEISFGENCSDAEKARTFEKYIYQHIREVPLPLNEQSTKEFSLPQTTLTDGYGSSADRAILLAAMLKTEKIKYTFIPVSSENADDDYTEILQKFPRNIYGKLIIFLPEENIYLLDSGLYADSDFMQSEEKISLLCRSDGTVAVSGLAAEHQGSASITRVHCDIELREDNSASVTVKIKFEGAVLESERENFARRTPAMEKQHMQQLAANIDPHAKIISAGFDPLARDFNLTMVLDIPSFAVKNGKFVSFALPEYQRLTTAAAIPAKARFTPMLQGKMENVSLHYSVTLPQGLTLAKEYDGIFARPVEEFFFRTDSDTVDGRYCFSAELELSYGIIPAESFARVLELNRMINHIDNRTLLFVTEGKQ